MNDVKSANPDLRPRNAFISFRQPKITHLMENAVYNELVRRGHSVDVGVVTAVEKNANGQSVRVPHEIDFVVNKGCERVYVQSAYAIRSDEKLESIAAPSPWSATPSARSSSATTSCTAPSTKPASST